jgi:type IV pilus assembly protein PilQ
MHQARTLPALAAGAGALLLLAAWSPPASAADASVTGAGVAAISEEETVVSIQLSLADGTPSVSAFRRSNPDQVVVDIAGATVAADAGVSPGGLVSGAVFSTFNDGGENVRLTLTLARSAVFETRTEGSTVVVTLRAGTVADPLARALGAGEGQAGRLSGPSAAVAGPALTTLDFQQVDDASRVILGLQMVEPAVTQPDRLRVSVDLPGAIMPSSLTRQLDSSRFFSAIDEVEATPTRSGVRVDVRLRATAEYSVRREGSLYILEFRTPAEILAQRDAAVQKSATAAPSTPQTTGGTGQANATGQEMLISGKGRTENPQEKFGSGGGAYDPNDFAWAEESSSSSGRWKGRRMSIDLQDADIHTVFRFIAETANLNIVASDDVTGKVTVRLKDVPWDQALASILQSKGLGAQRFGNIVRVAKIESIKAEQIAALEAKRAKDDYEDLQVYIAPLNYAKAAEVETQVKSVLSERGTVEVDARSNQLIIRDLEINIAQARELIKRLDKQNKQVAIDARFVEASSSFTRSLGIQWGSELNASATTGYPTGAFFPNSVGASGGLSQTGTAQFYSPGQDSLLVNLGSQGGANSAVAFSLGSIPGLIDLDARLSALENEGHGKIVSSPHILAADNESATVEQGARVPFLSQSQAGTNVQFVQASLTMSVTPHVTAEGPIYLDVTITNNRPDFGTTIQGNPQILTKEIKTRILVPDGDTTVLGGVYATEETRSQSRVPGLGNLPLLGYFFKNSLVTRGQKEMLVFITPRVVAVD